MRPSSDSQSWLRLAQDSNADAQAAACRSVGRAVATGNVLSSVNIRSNRPHTFQRTQPHFSQSQCLAHPVKVRVKSQPGSSSVSFRLVPGAYGGGDDGRKEKTANAGKFALSQWFESLIARRFFLPFSALHRTAQSRIHSRNRRGRNCPQEKK